MLYQWSNQPFAKAGVEYLNYYLDLLPISKNKFLINLSNYLPKVRTVNFCVNGSLLYRGYRHCRLVLFKISLHKLVSVVLSLHKKRSFPLRISSLNVIKSPSSPFISMLNMTALLKLSMGSCV